MPPPELPPLPAPTRAEAEPINRYLEAAACWAASTRDDPETPTGP